MNLNRKRIRRPNVRLWEIGDLSAAFACNISHRNKEIVGQNQWTADPYSAQESEYLHSSGQKKSEYCVSGQVVSPKMMVDVMQNSENKDPNSIRLASPFNWLVNGSKVEFGTITRKSRLIRRRRRSPNSTCTLFVGPWNSDADLNMHNANGLKDSTEHETPSVINEACEVEIDDHDFSSEIPHKPNEFSFDDDSYEDNANFTQSTNGINGNENGVREWLEELGLGKFAEMFEMHEVDEDALPLLTFEDLKEMGIAAVGPRRKLFRAIQLLKGGQ